MPSSPGGRGRHEQRADVQARQEQAGSPLERGAVAASTDLEVAAARLPRLQGGIEEPGRLRGCTVAWTTKGEGATVCGRRFRWGSLGSCSRGWRAGRARRAGRRAVPRTAAGAGGHRRARARAHTLGKVAHGAAGLGRRGGNHSVGEDVWQWGWWWVGGSASQVSTGSTPGDRPRPSSCALRPSAAGRQVVGTARDARPAPAAAPPGLRRRSAGRPKEAPSPPPPTS